MPKEEWGVKRVCPTTGKRFYDLNADPIVSPYTGEIVTFDANNKSRVAITDKEKGKADSSALEDDDAILEDDDNDDVDLDDELLDDDDDDDNVSLDDLTDVAGEDED